MSITSYNTLFASASGVYGLEKNDLSALAIAGISESVINLDVDIIQEAENNESLFDKIVKILENIRDNIVRVFGQFVSKIKEFFTKKKKGKNTTNKEEAPKASQTDNTTNNSSSQEEKPATAATEEEKTIDKFVFKYNQNLIKNAMNRALHQMDKLYNVNKQKYTDNSGKIASEDQFQEIRNVYKSNADTIIKDLSEEIDDAIEKESYTGLKLDVTTVKVLNDIVNGYENTIKEIQQLIDSYVGTINNTIKQVKNEQKKLAHHSNKVTFSDEEKQNNTKDDFNRFRKFVAIIYREEIAMYNKISPILSEFLTKYTQSYNNALSYV